MHFHYFDQLLNCIEDCCCADLKSGDCHLDTRQQEGKKVNRFFSIIYYLPFAIETTVITPKYAYIYIFITIINCWLLLCRSQDWRPWQKGNGKERRWTHCHCGHQSVALQYIAMVRYIYLLSDIAIGGRCSDTSQDFWWIWHRSKMIIYAHQLGRQNSATFLTQPTSLKWKVRSSHWDADQMQKPFLVEKLSCGKIRTELRPSGTILNHLGSPWTILDFLGVEPSWTILDYLEHWDHPSTCFQSMKLNWTFYKSPICFTDPQIDSIIMSRCSIRLPLH